MKALTGFIVGIVVFGLLFFAVDSGLMLTQGLHLFPDNEAGQSK